MKDLIEAQIKEAKKIFVDYADGTRRDVDGLFYVAEKLFEIIDKLKAENKRLSRPRDKFGRQYTTKEDMDKPRSKVLGEGRAK